MQVTVELSLGLHVHDLVASHAASWTTRPYTGSIAAAIILLDALHVEGMATQERSNFFFDLQVWIDEKGLADSATELVCSRHQPPPPTGKRTR
jgi:hypothetical protein